MSDHTVIAILVGVLALLAAGLGIVLGEQRRHRDEAAAYARQLEEHEKRLRAQSALIEVIAEDYDPPEPAQRRRRRALPEGWRIYNGGAAILLLTALGAWLRGHWRTIAPAAVASGGAAITAVAILSHTAPAIHHPQAGLSAAPAQTSAAPYTQPTPAPKPTPTTKPGHTSPRTMPPTVFVPVRRRAPSQSPELPTMPPLIPEPPLPLPSLLPSPSMALTTPGRSPTAACTPGITVHLPPIGLTVCP